MLHKKIIQLALVESLESRKIGKDKINFFELAIVVTKFLVIYCSTRMDKSAVGHDYVAKVEKHGSQTDAAKGFGGKFGVQTDRVDKVGVQV